MALTRKAGLDTANQPAATEHIKCAQTQVVALIIGEGYKAGAFRIKLMTQGEEIDRPVEGSKGGCVASQRDQDLIGGHQAKASEGIIDKPV